MRLDKLTSKFQMALGEAQSLAVGQDNQFIEPAHLMVALLDQQGGTVRGLLTKAGVGSELRAICTTGTTSSSTSLPISLTASPGTWKGRRSSRIAANGSRGHAC